MNRLIFKNELQAERVKQLVAHACYGKVLPLNDPFVALQRDSRSTTSGTSAADEAAIVKAVTDVPINALEALVAQHRNSHVKLIQTMQETEARHLAVSTYSYSNMNIIWPVLLFQPTL